MMRAAPKRGCVLQRLLTHRYSRALFSVLAVAMVLVAPGQAAAQCSSQLTNQPGDSITVVATLTTDDPNENGEGEPLIVTTSGGELSGTVSAYSLPTSFTYTAVAANETVLGSFAAPDGDEFCTVSGSVNAPSIFTPSQKRTANHVGVGLGLLGVGIGTVVLFTCTPPFTPVCLGLIAAGAGAAAGGIIGGGISGDPPDPDFMVIAMPQTASVPPFSAGGGLTQAEADAFNALLGNFAAVIGVGNAAITSANRAQGAFAAGNTFWEGQQTQAALTYLAQLGALYGAEPSLLAALQAALADAGVTASFTPSDVFSFESSIAFGGLPSSFIDALTTLGADQTMIDEVRSLLFVQDINAAAGTFPNVLTNSALQGELQDAAQALNPNLPPNCDSATGSLLFLWPPDHTFRSVGVTGVTDPDHDPVTVTITGVQQDEPLTGSGSGHTCPDAEGVGSSTVNLRAERDGTADGRVYHIAFTASDGRGGQCQGVVKVCVPHDRRMSSTGAVSFSPCVDEGPLFDSTGPCT